MKCIIVVLIIAVVIFAIYCVIVAYYLEQERIYRENIEPMNGHSTQGEPKATRWQDDAKKEHERRAIDPRTLFQFYHWFTFTVGRYGKAAYYYQEQGKPVKVEVKTYRIRTTRDGFTMLRRWVALKAKIAADAACQR